MKTLKSLKDDVAVYQQLKDQYEEIELLLEMGYEENDPEVIPEIQETLDSFRATFDAVRIKTLLSGEYDKANAIVDPPRGGRAEPSPATGLPCSTGCTAAGQTKKDISWKCWIIWTAMRRASNPLPSR